MDASLSGLVNEDRVVVVLTELIAHDVQGATSYYAMQFIQGQGLDQILAELRCLRGRTLNGAGAGSVSDGLPVAYASGSLTRADDRLPALDQLTHSLLTGRFEAASAAVEDEEVRIVFDPPEALDVSASNIVAAAEKDPGRWDELLHFQTEAESTLAEPNEPEA